MKNGILLLALGIGCDDKGAAAPSDMAMQSWGMSGCGLCVADACDRQIQACAADPGCAAFFGCLSACPTTAAGEVQPACEGACPSPASNAGLEAYDNLKGCRQTGRGSECAACGQAPDAGAVNPILTQACPPSTETDPCYICEDDHCCDSYQACHNDPACQALIACERACPLDSTARQCAYQCEAQNPAGLKNLDNLTTCVVVFCPACSMPSACETCVISRCLGTYVECRTNDDCELLSACTAPCAANDQACIDSCKALYPSAVDAWSNDYVCDHQLCNPDCA